MVKAAPRLATILWRWLGSCRACQRCGVPARAGRIRTLAMPMGLMELDSAMSGGCSSPPKIEGGMGSARAKLPGRLEGKLELPATRSAALYLLAMLLAELWLELRAAMGGGWWRCWRRTREPWKRTKQSSERRGSSEGWCDLSRASGLALGRSCQQQMCGEPCGRRDGNMVLKGLLFGAFPIQGRQASAFPTPR
jgi:hypothetical protein